MCVRDSAQLKVSTSPLCANSLPLGPLILSKGIYLLRALALTSTLFP